MRLIKFITLAFYSLTFLSISCVEAGKPSFIDIITKELVDSESLNKSINEICNFNQRDRDSWMKKKIENIPYGSKVLDLGAGTCPYKDYCSHCLYFTQDFMQYEGVKLGGSTKYGHIDFISDVTNIPVEECFFDAVICTEVLEHVLEPIKVIQEIKRVLKPGGKILLTAPFACGLHQEPYHYYTGFTPFWYEHFFSQNGLEIVELSPNGGFFKMLSQESIRVLGLKEKYKSHYSERQLAMLEKIFGDLLPKILNDLEYKVPFYQFTVGYHVEAIKI